MMPAASNGAPPPPGSRDPLDSLIAAALCVVALALVVAIVWRVVTAGR